MKHKVRIHPHQKMAAGQTPAAIPHSQGAGLTVPATVS